MTTPKPVTAYIALGANIDPESNLKRAMTALQEACQVVAFSSLYQSPAYGFADQPDFLNVTAHIETRLSPLEFKQTVLDPIEKQCGRDRASQINPNGPLPMDMDILLWGDSAFEYGEKPWRVPNKGILKFVAVALPLAELAPELEHPVTHQTMRAIVAQFSDADRAQVQKRAWSVG